MRPTANNDHERGLLNTIDRHGWQITYVSSDEKGGSFAYSIGIYERTGKPEIIVFSLGAELCHGLINDYGHRCAEGEVFEKGRHYEGFLDEALFAFLNVTDASVRGKYTLSASWYYQTKDYPLLQGVWPDKTTGAFPWEPGYRPEMVEYQPLLAPSPSVQ